MKTWHILLLFCAVSSQALGRMSGNESDDLVRVTVGSGADSEKKPSIMQHRISRYPDYNSEAHAYHDRELRERVRQLELAMQQMQAEIRRLRYSNPRNEFHRVSYACMIKGSFAGTQMGKGETLIEAKANALNACEKLDRGFCREEKVQCDKTEY